MKRLKKSVKRATRSVVNMHEAILQSERDLRDAVLFVSITANLFILCLWIAVRITAQYDSALTHFLFGR
jgi:hypothetical protein